VGVGVRVGLGDGVGVTPTAHAHGDTDTHAPLLQQTFVGAVGTRRGQAASEGFVINLSGSGTLTASITWKGGGSLTASALDANGNLVASASSTSSPETLSYTTSSPGQFTIRVIATSGACKFTLLITTRN
jgi:hypothetical protein